MLFPENKDRVIDSFSTYEEALRFIAAQKKAEEKMWVEMWVEEHVLENSNYIFVVWGRKVSS